MEQPQTRAVRLVDADDGALEVHLLPAHDDTTIAREDALGRLGQRCDADPDLVVDTVLHRAEPSQRVLALVEDVPGFGWAPALPATPRSPVGAVGSFGLGNGLVEIDVDPDAGTWSMDGLSGFGRLVDGGDVGDTYNWCPPELDTVVDHPTRVTVERTETGPARGTILIESELTLPERSDVDHDGRSMRAGTTVQRVRTTLELRAGEPFVRVTVELDHQVRDHRLRVHLPLCTPTDHSLAECAYAQVRRPLYAEGGPNEWGVPTFPSRRFVRAGGVLVAHEGLCEYELVDLDGAATEARTVAATLALTLVRATGWLSRGPMPSRPLPAGPEDALEGAQCQGPLRLRYAVALDADARVDPHVMVDQVFSPLRSAVASGGGDLAERGSRLRVRGATVDAVLPAVGSHGDNSDDYSSNDGAHRALDDRPAGQDGATVLRVHESWGEHGELVVEGRTGWVVDLRGTRLERFDTTMPLGPHQIVTLRLDPPP